MTDLAKLQADGVVIEVDENTHDLYACGNCGTKRFHSTFVIGAPAGYHYNTRYSCVTCDRAVTREEVLAALKDPQHD